jgi:ATP-binding cassette, subfamily B, bacterial
MKDKERYLKKARTALRVMSVIAPYRTSLIILFLLMLTGAAAGLVGPYVGKVLIDVVFKPNSATGRYEHGAMLLLCVAIIFSAQIVQQLFILLRARFSGKLGNAMLYDVRALMFQKLMDLSLSFFNRQQTGALVSKVSQDSAELQRFMADFFPVTAESLLMLMGAGFFLFLFNWRLTLIVVVPLIAGAFFLKKLSKNISASYRNFFERRAELSARTNDSIAGIRLVKMFGNETREAAVFDSVNKSLCESGIALTRQTSVFSPLFSFFVVLVSSTVWLAGGEMVLMKKMSLGAIIAFLGYLAMFYRPLMILGQVVGSLASSLSAAQRVFEIIDAHPEVTEAPDALALPRIKGPIEFRGVSFSFGEAECISKCSFLIHSGQRVAFVGKSGAGKSTMANVLCRLYDVTEGAVLIDTHDIRSIKIADIRRSMSMIQQDTFLFNISIFDNIAYAKSGATREEVEACAKASCAHDFILAKPNGYGTVIGERGVLLSGGEKQRIAIARALLHDPSVLILDEATSAMDLVTENLVLSALENSPRKRTIIYIAHRPQSPERFDMIFVMDKGKIVESGTHGDLMEKKGLYCLLLSHEAQA